MKTSNTIEIRGDPQIIAPRIYQLAAEIQNWGWILPHYRYLRVTEEDGNYKIADFGANRTFTLVKFKKRRHPDALDNEPDTYSETGFTFPVQWQARQETFPNERRITYQHIGGISKGMKVEWRITPQKDRVQVVIDHELTAVKMPLFGKWVADKIVGKLFVHHIAGKTLQCFKAIVETETEGNGAK